MIDSALALAEALKYPALKDIIKKLYPERLKPQPPNPPDPPPFKPMIISLEGDTPIPVKQNLNINLRRLEAPVDVKTKKAGAPQRSLRGVSRLTSPRAWQSAPPCARGPRCDSSCGDTVQ